MTLTRNEADLATPSLSSTRAALAAFRARAPSTLTALGVVLRAAVVACTAFAATLPGCDCRGPAATPDAGVLAPTPDAGSCAAGTSACACRAAGDVDGACDGGLVCDSAASTCRAPSACESAGCAQHQTCDNPNGGDATCESSCDSGFTFDAGTSSCTATPSCDSTAPGSIVATCDAQHRACDATSTAGGGPACGACASGFVDVDGDGVGDCVTDDCAGVDCLGRLGRTCDDSSGSAVCGDCDAGFLHDVVNDVCVDRVTCAEANCDAGDDCIEATLTVDASCVPPPNCDVGEVDSGGNCAPCIECFDFTGTLPVPLPGVAGVGNGGRAFEEKCVCAMQDGFFQDLNGFVHPCDADGDGWVTATLIPVLDRVGVNPHKDEERCTVETIDSVELVSDDADSVGEIASKTISLDEIVLAYHAPSSSFDVNAFGQKFVSLFEPADLDDPGLFDDRYSAAGDPALFLRPYGALAEHWKASEANPLTKACNDDDDDLNLDGVKDASEPQESVTAPAVTTNEVAAMAIFQRLAYFAELDRGSFVPPNPQCNSGGECFGHYRIEEKHRVAAADDGLRLELTYDDGDVDQYWRTCTRGRPPYTNGAVDSPAATNQDYARWLEDCDSATGTCRIGGSGRAPHVPYDGRDSGLSSSFGGLAPDSTDGNPRWPGMNHSSQFRCATFNPAEPALSPRRVQNDVHTQENPDGEIALLSCDLGGPGRVDDAALGTGANPTDPQIRCGTVDTDAAKTAALTSNRQNHWVAIRMSRAAYTDTADYPGGCVDESAEWGSFLCIDDPVSNEQTAFGKLFCGCGPLRGGNACESICDDASLFSDRTVSGGAVTGPWLCMRQSLSPIGVHVDAVSGYAVSGVVPFAAGPSQQECQNADCNVGYTFTPVEPLQ